MPRSLNSHFSIISALKRSKNIIKWTQPISKFLGIAQKIRNRYIDLTVSRINARGRRSYSALLFLRNRQKTGNYHYSYNGNITSASSSRERSQDGLCHYLGLSSVFIYEMMLCPQRWHNYWDE